MNELYTDSPAAANTNIPIAERESDAAYDVINIIRKKKRERKQFVRAKSMFSF